MSRNKTQSTYRGLVIADPRINNRTLNRSLSTVTEDGSLPGIPKPVDASQAPSPMVLQTTGTQEESLEVQTSRGGFPGTSVRSGGFNFRRVGDADDKWLGWDVPNSITNWECLWFSSTFGYTNPHVLRMSNGKVMLAMRRTDTTTIFQGIEIRTYDPNTGVWTFKSLIRSPDIPDPPQAFVHPCLVELPNSTVNQDKDPRVLVFFWIVDDNTDQAQIQMLYTDDMGSNWKVGSRYCLANPIDLNVYELGRIRGVYNAGQVLLVGEIRDPTKTGISEEPEALVQWASDDNGTTFAEVYRFDLSGAITENGAVPEVLPLLGGGFSVHYDDTLGRVHRYRRINNAFHSMGDVEPSDPLPHPENIDQDIAVWKGEDNVWYATARLLPTGLRHDMVALRSLDEGLTWTRMESGTGAFTGSGIWRDGGTTNGFTGFSACEAGGRSIMVTSLITPSAWGSHSIYALYLGGHSNLTRPSLTLFRSDARQITWERTWMGFNEPSVSAPNIWDDSTLGAATVLFGNYGMRVTTSVLANERRYFLNATTAPFPPATVDNELIVYFNGRLSSATNANPGGFLQVLQADGTTQYQLEIQFAETSFIPARYRVRDVISSVSYNVDFDVTEDFELLVAVLGPRVRVYHRHVGAPGSSARRDWELGFESDTFGSTTTSPGPYSNVSFGTRNIASMDFKSVFFTSIPTAGIVGLSEGFENPEDLYPRAYSRFPLTLADSGVRIAAVDGPTVQGEGWLIEPRALYGVEFIDPINSPSPRQKWRTPPGDTSEQTLVWDLSDTTEETPLFTAGPDGAIAVGIFGANWRTATLIGEDSLGNPTTIMEIDLASGLEDLPFTREGKIVRPILMNTETGVGRWFDEHELVGASLHIGADLNPGIRRVTSNTQGFWRNLLDSPDTQIPQAYCEGINGTEYDSGTLDISMPNGVFWRRGVPNPKAFRRLKLVIDSQDTAEGYLETGCVVIGAAHMFGKDYSRGRIIETEANTEVTTRRGGTRFSRNLGPDRRSVQFGWREGVDHTPVNQPDPDKVDFARAGTTGPQTLTTPSAVPGQVEGLWRRLGGADTLLVYLASVNGEADGVVPLTRRGDFIYGRLSGRVRQESFLGDEQDNEVIRVSSIEISEEV